MRLRSFATTAVLAGFLALTGATAAHAADPAPTTGVAANSPGVLSGNVVQIPVDLDVNACGNSINVVGLLNPATGNTCVSQ
ncbi:chaplin [Streptomyces sp. L2]|uniref:chaplin n=1 Tax=Streptomyces sp. L2 TaxID=2162665 RepID=UPI001013B842|nr:chaplin [Streptomyces sp. L2]